MTETNIAELTAVFEKLKAKALDTISAILTAESRVNDLDAYFRAGQADRAAGAAAMKALVQAQDKAFEAARRRDVAAAELERAEVEYHEQHQAKAS